MRAMHLWQVLAAAIIISAALLIAGVLGLEAAIHTHALATFDWSLAIDNQHIISMSNGPICLPNLPQLACESGLRRQEFRVVYQTGSQHFVFVSIVAP